MAYNQTKLAAASEDIKAKLLSGDSELRKTAGLAASEYFRVEIRENGIRRQITPPTTVTKENFDVVEDTDFPVMFVEIAPQSAGAYKVSFETGPKGEVIHGKKSRVEFNRVMTDKYSIDKIRLETYKMPILDIFYDLMLKDIMDTEDEITLAVDDAICGDLNVVNPAMGMTRYATVGTMSRAAIVALKKGMYLSPGGPHDQGLIPTKFLMNNITHCDFALLTRDQVGGDLAQTMFTDGVALTQISGVDTILTTKRGFVKDNDVYIYADPKFYGGFYTYKDVSMIVDEKDDIWLTFFAHETIGASVINAAGVLKASLTGTTVDWNTGV
jgi:hypothetical protein